MLYVMCGVLGLTIIIYGLFITQTHIMDYQCDYTFINNSTFLYDNLFTYILSSKTTVASFF